MSYDSKCYELAEHFLPTHVSERLTDNLAQEIQTCVEDWLNFECGKLAATFGVSNPESEGS